MGDDFPAKPKGMHWQMYWRQRNKAEEAELQSWPPWIWKMMGRSN
jgi:hypothetical protein